MHAAALALGDDLRPNAGSPAVDARTPLPGLETDADGIPRPPGNAPDLGAYERK